MQRRGQPSKKQLVSPSSDPSAVINISISPRDVSLSHERAREVERTPGRADPRKRALSSLWSASGLDPRLEPGPELEEEAELELEEEKPVEIKHISPTRESKDHPDSKVKNYVLKKMPLPRITEMWISDHAQQWNVEQVVSINERDYRGKEQSIVVTCKVTRLRGTGSLQCDCDGFGGKEKREKKGKYCKHVVLVFEHLALFQDRKFPPVSIRGNGF